MGSYTAAAIFGDVFTILAKRKNKKEATEVAHAIWRKTKGHDFSPDEMDVDEELEKLGLARESDDPDEDLVYGPAPKKRTPKR